MTYGLGSENQNLPGFIVLGQGAPAVGGASQWSQGFLPATHQGTLFRPGSNPIVDLHPRAGTSPESQRSELDLLKWLNQWHARQRSHTGELEARIAAYEMAFQMQTAAPELIDLSGESEATRKLYGLNDPAAETFGRQCLMARRMVERGFASSSFFMARANPGISTGIWPAACRSCVMKSISPSPAC